MQKIIQFISLGVVACSICACGAPQKPQQHNRGLDPEAQKGRTYNTAINNNPADNAKGKKDEYVNRIAKRISVVSDNPENNYEFKVVESPTAGIVYDKESNSILVSSALLAQLQDEAQLAAVLSLGVAKFSNSLDPDRETVSNLYRAGYDPNALVELQEAYVLNNGTQYSWLGTMYSYPLSPNIIAHNRNISSNISQGLLRGSEDYSKETTPPVVVEE